jgi:hypothetical protein
VLIPVIYSLLEREASHRRSEVTLASQLEPDSAMGD